jgi:hypothetical protein
MKILFYGIWSDGHRCPILPAVLCGRVGILTSSVQLTE